MIRIEKSLLPSSGEFKYFDFPEYKNEFLVYKTKEGCLKIYSSFCPHFGGPLSIKDDKLYCWFHAYEFDLESGVCLNRKVDIRCNQIQFVESGSAIDIEVVK